MSAEVPKMEKRDPRASEGATRALSHCNNIVKLAGINKSPAGWALASAAGLEIQFAFL